MRKIAILLAVIFFAGCASASAQDKFQQVPFSTGTHIIAPKFVNNGGGRKTVVDIFEVVTGNRQTVALGDDVEIEKYLRTGNKSEIILIGSGFVYRINLDNPEKIGRLTLNAGETIYHQKLAETKLYMTGVYYENNDAGKPVSFVKYWDLVSGISGNIAIFEGWIDLVIGRIGNAPAFLSAKDGQASAFLMTDGQNPVRSFVAPKGNIFSFFVDGNSIRLWTESSSIIAID